MGRRGARCAPSRRADLDLPHAKSTKRPLRSGGAVLLGRLEFFEEHPGGEGASDASVPALLGRADGCRKPWLRHPAIREAARFQDLAIEEPPKGTIYNYPPRGDVQVVIPYGE